MTAPHPLSHDQQRQVDIYGQGGMSDNIYGRGFMMQQPNWNTSVAQIGVTTQPLLHQNWQSKSMWANSNGVERDPNLLRVANNAEQISFIGEAAQFKACSLSSLSDYEMLMGGVGSNLAQPTNTLDYLSGSNLATSLIPEDAAWMNQSRHNPGLHDALGKLYPRSWNP
ncbi:hypothetical protein F2Q69_00018784 [Brassica cretica]|uniref:Uncharacterized protein n=1 Tax=Brassica cretica TaxID=69181 RepID=A0A8S9Q5Z4_BRACR|nr:hypothetical protein F2Q69_00018784 [Brassica cretica]